MMYPAGAAVSQTVYVPGSTLPKWIVPAAALSSGAALSVTESDPLPVKGFGVTLNVAPPSACWSSSCLRIVIWPQVREVDRGRAP